MSGTVLGGHKQAAKRLGITLDEYERHIDADESWCWQCRRWRLVALFRRRWGYSLDIQGHCADCFRAYMRVYMRRRYAARKAAAS